MWNRDISAEKWTRQNIKRRWYKIFRLQREECKTLFCVKKYGVPRQHATSCAAGEKYDWFWLPRQVLTWEKNATLHFVSKHTESQDNLQHPVRQVKNMTDYDWLDKFWLERRMQDFILCQNTRSPKTTCNILCRRWKSWLILSRQLFDLKLTVHFKSQKQQIRAEVQDSHIPALCDFDTYIKIRHKHEVSEEQMFNPYPTAFPYGNGMVLHFYQQQESSTTKTVHKVINKGLKTYV